MVIPEVGNVESTERSWNFNDAIVSWDMINFVINDLSHSSMKKWLTKQNQDIEETYEKEKITIFSALANPLESTKKFILQRYLIPGKYRLTRKKQVSTYLRYRNLSVRAPSSISTPYRIVCPLSARLA